MCPTFDGVHVALVTPFDEKDRVNEDSLGGLVEDQIAHGIHGLVVNGSTGEFASLSPRERQRNVEVVALAAMRRVPMTVQVGAMTTREAVEHAEHAAESGAACVLLVSPYYERLDEDEIEEYVRAVAGVGLPVMLYNNPAGTGWSMTPELIAHLSNIDGVQYLKDTTGDARRLFRVRELCGERMEILNGQDSLALLGFLAGARGTVWGAPNGAPSACLELWRLTVEALDLEEARRLWSVFYPVNRFFEDEGYVAAVKAAANLRGLDVGKPRRPIMPLSPRRVEELTRLLNAVDALRSTPYDLASI